jgi:hypothetical protein
MDIQMDLQANRLRSCLLPSDEYTRGVRQSSGRDVTEYEGMPDKMFYTVVVNSAARLRRSNVKVGSVHYGAAG